MLMKLWPWYWEYQLDWMNKKVDKENGRGGTQDNGQFWKFQRFSRRGFWKNIECLLSAPTVCLGRPRLWEKDPKISGNKNKRSLIRLEVDLYEVFQRYFKLFIIIVISILIIIFLLPDLWHLSH